MTVMVFADQDRGTRVDEEKEMKRRTWGTQVSSETRVLYSWQRVLSSLELELKLIFPSPVAIVEFSKFADVLSTTL